MLPLLSLLAVGAMTTATIVRSKRRAILCSRSVRKRSGREGSARGLPPGTFKILGQSMEREVEVVLAREDVPMDNRFGNQPFVSEHEFTRTAKVSINTDLGNLVESESSFRVLSILQAELDSRLLRKLGVAVGAQFSRHIRLKFTAAPGEKVLYRLLWKQSSQRGLFKVGIGRHCHHIPYMVTFGLSYAVQSIAVEQVDAAV